jgi:hypothetical protein
VLASRQNQAAGGRHPWCLVGSLNRAVGYATDALQVHGLSRPRRPSAPVLATACRRRGCRHEHAMAALQDAVCELAAGQSSRSAGSAACKADHPAATASSDLAASMPRSRCPKPSRRRGAPSDRPPSASEPVRDRAAARTLDLDEPTSRRVRRRRRHVERDRRRPRARLLPRPDRHVVLRAKELAVLRPHGHCCAPARSAFPTKAR